MPGGSEPYPDVIARFYDAVYAHVRDGVDNEWYLDRMARAGGAVLEIGVGTGRLFAEARRRGLDVWGIDVSPAMIERCREKLAPVDRERVQVADAVSFQTDRRFALVCAPFRVLSHVYDAADQLRLLDTVHDCLQPGGAFLFDLYVPNLKLLVDGLTESTDFDGEWAPGRRLRRLTSAGPADLARQTTPVCMTFVWDEEDGEHRKSWAFEMRFFFRFEIEHLVARSTLRLESIHGSFAGEPLAADSREFIVTCRRPESDPIAAERPMVD
jgi:SAM-dependent methyltransferase